MANQNERIVIEAVDNTTRGMRSAQNKLNSLDRLVKRVQTTMLGFVGINIGINIVKGLNKASDAAVELEAKLRLMTDGTENFNQVQKELVEISKESGSALDSNIILFTRMNRAIQALGGSSQTTTALTRAMSQGLRISGASAQESASVVRQFSQAMSSGVLRGEEFNAIMENGGRIAIALADGLGVPIGKLREMAQAGELTAERVTAALLSQSQRLAEENAKLPLTIGRAFENVRTEWTLLLSTFKTGNAGIANAINAIAENFTEIAKAIKVAVEVAALFYGAKALNSIINYGKELQRSFVARQAQIQQDIKAARFAALEDTRRERAAIKATALQQARIAELHAEQIAVTAVNLASAKTELLETRTALRRAKNGVAYNAAITSSTQSISLQIAAEQKLYASQLKNEQNAVIRTRLEQKLVTLATQRSQVLKQQAVATTALKSAEVTLTAAYANQQAAITGTTAALAANTAAKRASTVAATANATVLNAGAVATTRLSVAMSRLVIVGRGIVTFFGRLASALLGLPGLIVFGLGMLLGEFYDLRVLLEVLTSQLKKFFAILANPIDFFFNSGDLQAKLDEIDNQFSDWYLKREADQNAQAKGFKDAEDQKVQDLQTLLRKQQQLESDLKDATAILYDERATAFKDMLENMDAAAEQRKGDFEGEVERIEFETELEDAALKQRLENKDAYEKASLDLKTKSNKAIIDTTIDFYEGEKSRYGAFYQQAIVDAKDDSTQQLALRVKRDEFMKEANISIVESLRTSIAEMTDLEQGYLDSARSAAEKRKDIAKDYQDFLVEINGDTRAEYQKDLDADKERLRIQSELDRAATLDKKTNADEIAKITDQAIIDSKALVKEESARSKALAEGSVDQAEAFANTEQALGTLSTAVAAAQDAQTTLQQQGTENAKTTRNAIEERANSLKAYEAAIVELDKSLAVGRQIVVGLNEGAALASIAKIDAEIKKLNQDVIINVKEIRSKDGSDDSSPTVKRASGGFIPRTDKVGGTGSGDKVKALLEPGEFIMRKSAVQKFGESTMYAMNRGEDIVKRQMGGMIPRFASGGAVTYSGNNAGKTLKEIEEEFRRIAETQRAQTGPNSQSRTSAKTTGAEDTNNGSGAIVAGLISKYASKLKDSERTMNSGGSGMNAYMKKFHAQTTAKYMTRMMKSAGSMQGKSPEQIAVFASINEKVISLLSSMGRGTRSSVRPRVNFIAEITNLINERNARTGGGEAPISWSGGGSEGKGKGKGRGRGKGKDRDDDNVGNAEPAKDPNRLGNQINPSKILAQSKLGASARTKLSEEIKRYKGFNIGGLVQKFAEGGKVAGSGLGDTVKALLTPGEFVMKKGVVQSFGQDFFKSLNSGIMPQRFAAGGSVGASVSGETINVNLTIGDKTATGTFGKNDATMAIINQLKQAGAAA